ncbi:MAG: hypothetical protein E6J81_05685 [Deltaproteobacteria bacterium]|nr:MAG: hypothetical protein E6J81_05685 [Deltaproteobacteria bacterium]
MRTLVALLGVVALGAAGCSALHRSGGQGTGRRFYLTVGTFPGNKVLDACAHGYHMASRFELLDVALLRYDSGVGFTTDDAGSGPPSHAAAYGSQDPSGWVRTGGSSRFTDTADRQGSALTNCAAWSTSSPDGYGTVAYLSDRFTVGDGAAAPLWNGGSERCDVPHHVWCIADQLVDDGRLPDRTRDRRGRRGGEDTGEE